MTAVHSTSTRLLGLALWLWAGTAQASPNFPGVIADELPGAPTPACTLCHNNALGGADTATTPFGMTVSARGLQGQGDADMLRVVLGILEAENKDTDGDNISDLDELSAGTDPNVAGGDGVEPASYGCSVSTSSNAPGTTAPWHLAWPALALVGLHLRRRHLKSPQAASHQAAASAPGNA